MGLQNTLFSKAWSVLVTSTRTLCRNLNYQSSLFISDNLFSIEGPVRLSFSSYFLEFTNLVS